MPENHIRFSDDRLQAFYVEFRAHVRRQDERYEDLLERIAENTRATNSLAEKVGGLLEAWETATTAVRMTAAIGRIVRWAGGVAAAAATLWYLVKHGAPPKG